MQCDHYTENDRVRIESSDQLKVRVFEANGVKLVHAAWKKNGVPFAHLYHNKRRVVIHYVHLMKTGEVNAHDINFNATPLATGIEGTERTLGIWNSTQAKEYEAWYIECMKDGLELAKGVRPAA